MQDPPVDPAALGWRTFPADGFASLVGPLWHRPGDEGGPPRFAMLADARHTNHLGLVHGGMLMSFADSALGMTVWDIIGRQPCVTIQFGMQFLESARPGDFVEADIDVLRRTASVVFVRGILRCGDRRIGAADGVWKLVRAKA